VRRLKGPGRPLIPQDERAEVVAALAAVDWVVIFHENTALELVRSIRPGIYVKGGDYAADPGDERFPIEGHAVLDYGGAVRILDHVSGWSTTEIVDRAMARMGMGGYNRGS
jgi:D-beta-D-heptose 7-phosphate kinase/D-beta-D-heptose 1-phosphate adenosyltransferase